MEIDKSAVIAVVAIVLVFIMAIICSWNQEAKTFNKFKRADQPEATIIDAMFAELRVEN